MKAFLKILVLRMFLCWFQGKKMQLEEQCLNSLSTYYMQSIVPATSIMSGIPHNTTMHVLSLLLLLISS